MEENQECNVNTLDYFFENVKNGKLYKYRSFNDYSLKSLENNTLYCSDPMEFNDPFDCKFAVNFDAMLKFYINQELTICQKYIRKYFALKQENLTFESCNNKERKIFELFDNINFLNKVNVESTDLNINKNKLCIELSLLINSFDIISESENMPFLKAFIKNYKSLDIVKNIALRDLIDLCINKNSSSGYDIDLESIMEVLRISMPKEYEATYKILERIYIGFSKKVGNQFKIGCLTTSYENKLMWSHYADSHKGFCIEYDFSTDIKKANSLILLPVVYSDERVQVPFDIKLGDYDRDFNVRKKANTIMFENLFTKDRVWTYENEWRILISSNVGLEVGMPPISCIYIGASCPCEDKGKLLKIAKDKHIPVKQMKTDFCKYKLYAEEIKV